jgi:hypothetical protein
MLVWRVSGEEFRFNRNRQRLSDRSPAGHGGAAKSMAVTLGLVETSQVRFYPCRSPTIARRRFIFGVPPLTSIPRSKLGIRASGVLSEHPARTYPS